MEAIELDRIYNEDCLEGMKRIPDGSIDFICCDLPYGVLNKQSEGGSWDTIIPFEQMWQQYKRTIKDNGAIVLFCQGLFTAKLMMSNPSMWRYNIIWDKERATGFLNAKRMPLRIHEDIAVFYKKLPTYNPQMTKCQPHQRNHSRGRQEGKQTNRCYGQYGKADDIISDEKYPQSIIRIQQKVQGNYHPTQKPVELIQWLIRTFSNEGDTVLDSCMGSGTTAVACILEKRHFIGFELDEGYYKIACDCIKRQLSEPGLF